MSSAAIARSADLRRLVDEGYELDVIGGHLAVGHVPFVTTDRTIAFGMLVAKLNVANDVALPPEDHVIFFAGSTPCDRVGRPLAAIINESQRWELEPGLWADHRFSSKPVPTGTFRDFHDKFTAYVDILGGHAEQLDPAATARTFHVIARPNDESPFRYLDTASSRAGIAAQSAKLAFARIGIVGLGGTGSYVLDFVAKTHVREIHLFDGDTFGQHCAYRSPGAPSGADLEGGPTKVEYLAAIYDRMRTGVFAHPDAIDETNVNLLDAMEFVFVAMDPGPAKRIILERLVTHRTPFIDVGMGVSVEDGELGGILRVTTVTPDRPSLAGIPLGTADANNDYSENVQIAELNALNAALAVIRWKKLAGFYRDLEGEQTSLYTIDGNDLVNE